uniref:ZSWIM1/3 RNaseH-like domain-containing protein n=1 Tax=Biomphalaria glabrata TaxID=6526 RepID=A0A2C9M5Z0_BIOGL
MVGTKISQSELRQIILHKQNKCVLGKDVENYRRKLKDPCTDSEGVEKILNSIKVGGGMVKYGVTPENEFLYLAYMTKEMIDSLKANKTILIIDCTYKVNEYLFPLLNVMCIDANGNGVLVLHAFVRNESVEILSECLSVLHDVCVEPQIIFVDKDFSEIGAIKQVFPQSLIRLCSFHTMTAVKKYLNTNVSKELSNKIFDLFKEQSYTLSEEAFELLKVDIISECPSVESYFQNNWWSISDMWAACRNTDVAPLHITTTNHVESYHSRIKKHLDSHTTLSGWCCADFI